MTDWIADFGRTAADYDRHRPGFPDSLYVRLASLGWIRRGLRTLDVGTGTGSLALGLARRGLDVVGIDPASELLGVAARRAEALGVDVRFREGTAEETGLEAASLDLVTAGHCWWWLDADRTMAEVKRVLVPGGRLLIANFSYLPTAGGAAAATERLILAHNPRWPKSGESGVFEDQLRDLDGAGLAGVESFSYVEPVTFTHEGWRGRIRACSGVGASLVPAAVEAFDRELTELLAASFPDELVIPHRVFVATGRVGGR
jgi:SAM-dependent methyltransferase